MGRYRGRTCFIVGSQWPQRMAKTVWMRLCKRRYPAAVVKCSRHRLHSIAISRVKCVMWCCAWFTVSVVQYQGPVLLASSAPSTGCRIGKDHCSSSFDVKCSACACLEKTTSCSIRVLAACQCTCFASCLLSTHLPSRGTCLVTPSDRRTRDLPRSTTPMKNRVRAAKPL